jgi:uncharacterized spore protein YtfJ
MAFVNVSRVDLAMGFSAIMGEFTAGGAQNYTLGPGRVAGALITPTESSTTNSDASGSGGYTITYASGSATLTMFGNGTFLIFLNTGR